MATGQRRAVPCSIEVCVSIPSAVFHSPCCFRLAAAQAWLGSTSSVRSSMMTCALRNEARVLHVPTPTCTGRLRLIPWGRGMLQVSRLPTTRVPTWLGKSCCTQ